jgi:hypothetical protein
MAAVIFEGWAIIEIFGHRRLAGFVREVEIFGAKMAQVEVPALPEMKLVCGVAPALPPFVQRLAGAAIFSITEVPEAAALRAAANIRAHAPPEIAGSLDPVYPVRQLEAAQETDEQDDGLDDFPMRGGHDDDPDPVTGEPVGDPY